MPTVLMATHNGAKTLLEVLKAYCKLDSPDGGWKLVIVNNGSTDGTKRLVLARGIGRTVWSGVLCG